MAGYAESCTPLQHHSPGEAAVDASYCFFSLPKQIQLGLELHCPILHWFKGESGGKPKVESKVASIIRDGWKPQKGNVDNR